MRSCCTSSWRSQALVLGRLAILLVAKVGEAFLRALRKRLFDHLMSLSLDFFEREKTGKIVARMTSDIDAMQELISPASCCSCRTSSCSQAQ